MHSKRSAYRWFVVVLLVALTAVPTRAQAPYTDSGDADGQPVRTLTPGLAAWPHQVGVQVREAGPVDPATYVSPTTDLQQAGAVTDAELQTLTERVRTEAEQAPPGHESTPGARLKLLQEQLDLPLADLQRMGTAEIRQLIEAHAATLQMDIYEWDAEAGEHVLKVKGRPTAAEPAGKVDGLPRLRLRPLADPPVLDQATVDNRTMNAYVWWLRNTSYGTPSSPAGYAFAKEYPGYPLWLKNDSRPGDGSYPRMLGHFMDETHNHKFGFVTWYATGVYSDLADVLLEEAYDWDYSLHLWADRVYYTNGVTEYDTCLQSRGDSEDVDVYLNAEFLFNTLAQPLNFCWSVSTVANGFQQAFRYVVGHGQQLGRNVQHAMGVQLHTDAQHTGLIGDALAYPWDLYDPLFGLGAERPDDFVFSNETYKACDWLAQGHGIDNPHPWGLQVDGNGTFEDVFYHYESKVCLSRAAYILLSRADYLATALQAIHILNKYGDPDHYYTNPNYPGNGLGASITPRQLARWLEGKWNGYGIPAYLKDSQYASGVRTHVFAVLETILGYKFGDATSVNYASATLLVLLQTQWGSPPFTANSGETQEHGVLFRPTYAGAALAGWKTGGSYPYAMPPKTFYTDLLDYLGMPHEVEGPVLSNFETTATYFQALRVYSWFRWGNPSWSKFHMLPRRDIKLQSGVTAIGLHVASSDPWFTSSELLAEIRAQGGTAYRVETYTNGYYNYCTWLNASSCASGTNFEITPGRGYLVHSTSASTYRPGGFGLGAPWPTLLNGGYPMEFIGIPYISTGSYLWYDLRYLHTRLVAAGCGAVNVYRYDLPSQSWVFVGPNTWYEFSPVEALRVSVQNTCWLLP